jgi:glycosyltransferase involved in cell wall biosynthesis
MRVYYDHQIFCEQSFGGISRYFFELIKGANDMELFTPILDVNFSNNVFSQQLHPDNHWLTNAKFKGKKDLVRLINRMNTFIKTRSTASDIFHPTYFHQSALTNRLGKPMFITVLDMIDEKYHASDKKFNKLIRHRERVITAADHIIAISENTRKDIIEHFKIDPNKITTIHLGCSLEPNAIAKIEKDEKTDPYVLYIGSRKGAHKNFINYLKAIEIIGESARSLQFVFGGGGNFTNEEKDAISKTQLGNRIVYLPIHGDEDIIRLYKNATILMYPSLYEGFGLPIVEAFSCGLPCVTAKGSCLEEVGGDAAAYFDPLNPSEMAKVALEVMFDPLKCTEMVEKGFKRGATFTWKNTVLKTHQLYQQFLAD